MLDKLPLLGRAGGLVFFVTTDGCSFGGVDGVSEGLVLVSLDFFLEFSFIGFEPWLNIYFYDDGKSGTNRDCEVVSLLLSMGKSVTWECGIAVFGICAEPGNDTALFLVEGPAPCACAERSCCSNNEIQFMRVVGG
jgi:hypothetical protein